MSEDAPSRNGQSRAKSGASGNSPGGYIPPDPTKIENSPEALDFWSRTLGAPADKIRDALEKVGPILDAVKTELGQGGIG